MHDSCTIHARFMHDSRRRIVHPDSFAARLRKCIADEPVAAFARRCGISEGLIRSYLKAEKQPGMERLVRIADAAGVSIEWLATGRGPMRCEAANMASYKDFSNIPYASRLEKIGLLLANMTEQEATAFLDEFFSRIQTAAEVVELRRKLEELSSEIKKHKKTA